MVPSLKSLKAFHVAAQLGSFTLAARELRVTQSAISRHVISVEKELGIPLFVRIGRRVVLAPAGQEFARVLDDAFKRIEQGTNRMRVLRGQCILTVSVLPSFASKWLVPRLETFLRKHPEIDLRISASYHPVDFSHEGVDLAIRYGVGGWPRVYSELLMSEKLVPVCSPKLLQGRKSTRRPDDLRHFSLLHGEIEEDWSTWLETVEAVQVDPTRGPRFTDAGSVLQAAIEGQGIALARSVLAIDDISRGLLVRLPLPSLPTSNSYYLVHPLGAIRAEAEHLQQWLRETAQQEFQSG